MKRYLLSALILGCGTLYAGKAQQHRALDQVADVNQLQERMRETDNVIQQILTGRFHAIARSAAHDDLFDDLFDDKPTQPKQQVNQSGVYISIDTLDTNEAALAAALRLGLAYEQAYADVPMGTLITKDDKSATCIHVGPLNQHDAARLLRSESGLHHMVTNYQSDGAFNVLVGYAQQPTVPNRQLISYRKIRQDGKDVFIPQTIRSYDLHGNRLADKRVPQGRWLAKPFFYNAACMRHFHQALNQ